MGPPGQLFAPAVVADAGTMLVAGSVATASTDGTRLVTGTSKGCGPACGVAEGPFVLTDARVLETVRSTDGVTWFYTVPAGTDCTVSCRSSGISSTTVDFDVLIALSDPGSSLEAFPLAMAGGRYFIPVGRRLCVCKNPTPFGAVRPVNASWAGFVPYQ
ncbi:MAG TPA: hypothetical protein VI356_26105 [Myxococcales bacterium]